jgi:Xaa-Pro aminopeptidase
VSLIITPERIDAVRAATAAAGLDALVITPGAELRYLTGYDAKALERLTALLVPREGPATLLVPRLELPAAEAAGVADSGVSIIDVADGEDAFVLVGSLLSRALGAPAVHIGTSERLWAAHWHALTVANPGFRLRLAAEVLTPMRMVKSPEEIAELARAGAAIDRVHRRMAEWLRPGRTEAEVAADIAAAIIQEGHQKVSFVIVGSGPNGASPHHAVSERVLSDGDPVVIDIGGTVDSGYGSDCTRTYCLGEPPRDFTEYYGALRAAHQAGVKAVAPGVTAEEVDAAARAVLISAGYGDHFTHRTGHGIGLEDHEEPYIVAGDRTRLRPGMAFSVEPGVYLPGRHGARIEDIVVCTDTGVRLLNDLSTELIIL